MDENDRKHFLKKFFSLNASSSVSSTNESFNDEVNQYVDSQLAAAAAATQASNQELGLETELNSADEKSKYIKFIKNNMYINLKNEQQPSRPQILISSDQESQKNEASKLVDDSSASTTVQFAPVYAQKKLNGNNGAELNARSLLEQQHSIELRPFRRKEVQIDLKNLRYSQFSSNFDDETAVGSNELLIATPITPVALSTPLTTYTVLTPIRDKVGVIGVGSDELPFIETSPRYQKLVGNLSLNGVILPQISFHKFANIRYRNLGKSGLRVSQFGLGTWVTFGSQISDDTAEEILTTAYHNGINLFDTSEVYAGGKAELALGRILKKKGWRRSSYIVCTRLYWGGKAETERGLSRKHIIEGVKASLERLQLDYVDIVFACKPDAATPIEEIVRSFTHLINTEKTFYWGTSRWNAMEIMEAYSVARQFNLIPPICEQAEYHLFQRDEVELNLPDVNAKIGIGTMTWSPLACGILTGKYDDGIPPNTRAALKGFGWLKDRILNEEGKKKLAKVKELQMIADKLNCTMAQLAIAWCLKNEAINCVLLGASSVEQLIENIQSLLIVPKLSVALMSDIDRILGNKPMSRQTSKSDVLQKV